jgi:hypothetical protein
MKIENILNLNEGISQIVYHHANANAILSIIKGNTFKLSSTFSKQTEKDHSNKSFYLSTTRSRVGSYHYSHNMDKSLGRVTAMLKLDGQALSSVASGSPVDYWGRDFRKVDPSKNEMEDRITSNKPTIPNAMKYILSLECFYDGSPDTNSYNMNPLRDLIKQALEHGITVNLYKTKQDFITGKRAIQNDKALEQVNDYGPELEPYNRGSRESFLQPYIDLMKIQDKSDLPEASLKILRQLSYSYDFNVALRSLQADFHNENRHDDSRTLTVLAKKAGAKNLTDLLNFIKQKFDKS